MDKKQIRLDISKRKDEFSNEDAKYFSSRILNHLLRLPEYFTSNVILCYASMEKEVDTYSLILSAFMSGKEIYLPRIISKGIMEFYKLNCLEELKEGTFGILEPTSDIAISYASSMKYTMVMPGLAFDKKLHRIGYGAGFYDRYLEKIKDKSIHTIALTYDFQVYEDVPTEEFDYRPEILVTESRILRRDEVPISMKDL